MYFLNVYIKNNSYYNLSFGSFSLGAAVLDERMASNWLFRIYFSVSAVALPLVRIIFFDSPRLVCLHPWAALRWPLSLSLMLPLLAWRRSRHAAASERSPTPVRRAPAPRDSRALCSTTPLMKPASRPSSPEFVIPFPSLTFDVCSIVDGNKVPFFLYMFDVGAGFQRRVRETDAGAVENRRRGEHRR